MRPPVQLLSQHRQKVPTVHGAKHSLPVVRAVNHSKRPRLISETWRERNVSTPVSLYPLHLRQAKGLKE